jgi:glycosyltransferase involved in cell wall biosynthesis
LKCLFYLSYHYPPDLSAGSFRNAALSEALAERLDELGEPFELHVFCTQPNRYLQFSDRAPKEELRGKVHVHRMEVPQHGNGFIRQVISFLAYRRQVFAATKSMKADFVFASSSKLFTAHLAYRLARRCGIPYYLDIRDLFADNVGEMIRIPVINRLVRLIVRHFFEQPCLHHAAHINLNSPGFKDAIPRKFGGGVSFFPNGIDREFSDWRRDPGVPGQKLTVCYAGNIGEAQGLHRIVPALARLFADTHRFLIIGGGSARQKLERSLRQLSVENVELLPPVGRSELLHYYRQSDCLLLHLNDYPALGKVLPSKLFEYGAGNLPIVAGVSGCARTFALEEIRTNVCVFDPCDVEGAAACLREMPLELQPRPWFLEKFGREQIAKAMADSICQVMRTGHG